MDAPTVIRLALDAAGDPPNLDWLGPIATAIGAVLVSAVGGISLVWRRRQDRKESIEDKVLDAQPSVTDGWKEVNIARTEATRYYRLYRLFEDMFYTVHAALRALARKVHEHHPDEPLHEDVVKALALRPPDDLTKV